MADEVGENKTIGKKFYEIKSSLGRPLIFKSPEAMWKAAVGYFEWCDSNPFLKSEQNRQAGKPTVTETGVVYPDPLVEMPVMRPYTLEGICLYMEVNVRYLNDFYDRATKREIKGLDDVTQEQFSEVITRIRETVDTQQFSGASSGFFNANIIARKLGLTNKIENTVDMKNVPLFPKEEKTKE